MLTVRCKYEGEFDSASILLPFLNSHMRKFSSVITASDIVFQKRSPVAAVVSKAILKSSENGELKILEDKWFSPSRECSSNATDNNTTESLNLQSFWGIYIITGTTSTVCFLLSLFRLLKNYHQKEEEDRGNATPSDKSVRGKTVTPARYIYHGETVIPGGSPISSPSPDIHERDSSRWELSSPEDTP
ncbi:unnamed protein product [Dovyalis caffra]|uniref:Uncharacterized protein n=1 Tax=Dovyalis caffra TaxID=77055 RepID=A0AAV1SJ88_9ROSI|nr:unnamed protein product [Dovyalis caffra]